MDGSDQPWERGASWANLAAQPEVVGLTVQAGERVGREQPFWQRVRWLSGQRLMRGRRSRAKVAAREGSRADDAGRFSSLTVSFVLSAQFSF